MTIAALYGVTWISTGGTGKKSYDRSNVKAYSTYGTSRINAYKIIEETLNLKEVRIFDYVEDVDGKKKPVLNTKETAIAQAKQEQIKQGFQDWVWRDPQRRELLCKIYNEKFNSTRPREYDGSHKYGAYATGITQNVDDLLQSHTARTMLANSEFIIMLNQASTDRLELAKLLNISDLQMSYITNVEAGHGLIKVGSSLVPFANKFPRNTKLYKLMTTKPGEGA